MCLIWWRRTMNAKQILTLFALTLFFGFSFNAHACLVPVYAVASMGNGCAEPEQEPVRQFCDTFKFLGPQSVSDFPHPSPFHTLDAFSATPLTPSFPHSVMLVLAGLHVPRNAPLDVLSRTTVLRI